MPTLGRTLWGQSPAPPEQRLLCAVLLQALLDAGLWRDPRQRHRPHPAQQAEARAWVQSAACALLCELAGVDVETLRAMLPGQPPECPAGQSASEPASQAAHAPLPDRAPLESLHVAHEAREAGEEGAEG